MYISGPNKAQIEHYETDILYFYLLATARLRFSWQIIYPIANFRIFYTIPRRIGYFLLSLY